MSVFVRTARQEPVQEVVDATRAKKDGQSTAQSVACPTDEEK